MKKSSVVLIILSVLVLCACVFVVMTYQGSEGTTTTLLKDMGSDELRVVGDKTDVYNNQEGSFVIKGEKPDGYYEPEDMDKYIKDNESTDNNGNSTNENSGNNGNNQNSNNSDEEPLVIIRDSVFVGNPNKGELKEYEPGEHSTVIEEIITVEKPKEDKKRISYQDAMIILQNYLNQEDDYIYGSFLLTSLYHNNVYLSDLMTGKGTIIIPFSVSNDKQLNNVKSWVSVYEKYKNEYSFVFLNTDLEFSGFMSIDSVFEKKGITKDLPIYASEFGDILGFVSNGDLANQGYILLDSSCYVVSQGLVTDKMPNLSSFEKELEQRELKYTELENLVTEKYNEGWIVTYTDVKKAVDGTLTAPETENETETEIENNVTE